MRIISLVALLSVGLAGAEKVTFAPLDAEKDPIVAETVSLGDGRLATVAVVGCDTTKAVSAAGASLKVIALDPVSRLAVLESESTEEAPARGSALGLMPGDAVYLPDQQRASRIVRWEDTVQGKTLPIALLRVNHPFEEPPAPGTPLRNAEGEVVAICHQVAPRGYGNATYALPVEVIERVLHDLKSFGEISPCWLGVVVNAADPVLSIEMVRDKSPGAAAGIQKGDILLSVGPRRVSSYAQARDAFYYLVAGRATSMTLLRGTKRIDVKVIPEVHPLVAAQREAAQ